ncbi:MAG: hypothetical protein AAFX94_21905, partial [Myxococcota bacterium]
MRALIVIVLTACAVESPPAPVQPERCLELPPAAGVEVARVGRTALTTDRLRERIEQEGATAMRRYRDPAVLREFVEDQIRFELLAFAAMERDLHRDPDVVEAARKVMVRKLLESDLSGEAIGASVAESDV